MMVVYSEVSKTWKLKPKKEVGTCESDLGLGVLNCRRCGRYCFELSTCCFRLFDLGFEVYKFEVSGRNALNAGFHVKTLAVVCSSYRLISTLLYGSRGTVNRCFLTAKYSPRTPRCLRYVYTFHNHGRQGID